MIRTRDPRNSEKLEKLLDKLFRLRERKRKEQLRIKQKNSERTILRNSRGIHKSRNNYSSKLAIMDEEEKRQAISLREALAVSPDITKLKAVVIDDRTVIYILRGRNTVIAKQNFIDKYQNNYGINNQTDGRGSIAY